MAAPPPFFTIGDQEDLQNQIKQQQQQSSSTPASSAGAPPHAAPQKKRRNLPGTPNPDAEVIALSPKTLLATNRFICEVCNKGFQREQNLQLHRRGHNLPWKLRQKSPGEVRQRVYLCPEPSCVHHDPSRALGDLTGIKKHFCRKHGEKKWKCDKCSKRYAVQSDLKAHSKTCGTREYRCGCGTLFSRRDSFITHRAFCDALTQDNACRLPTGLTTMGSQLYSSSNMGLGLSQLNTQIPSLPEQNQPSTDLLRLGGTGGRVHFDHFVPPTNRSSLLSPTASSTFFLGGHNQDFQESQSHHPLLPNKPFHGLMQLPHELQNSTATSSSAAAASVGNLFNLGFFSTGSSSSKISSSNEASHQNPHLMVSEQFSSRSANAEQAALLHRNLMRDDHMGSGESSLYDASVQSESVFPQISATALLQKAAQIGATTSSSGSFLLRGFESSYSSSSATPTTNYRANFGSTSERESMRTQIESETRLQHLMNSLADGNVGIDVMSSGAEAAFRGSCTGGGHEEVTAFGGFNTSLCNMDEAKLSRNLSSMGRMAGSDRLTRDFLGIGSMVRSMGGGMSQREPHHGIDVAYSEMKSGSTSRPFEGHNL